MFDVNTDMGIVVTIMVIAILVLVVVVIMMVSSHSREQMKALSDISAQIKETNDRPVPEPQVIQYVPVMAPQAAEGTATEGTVSAGMPDGHAEGIKEAGDAAEKTTDPLEEIQFHDRKEAGRAERGQKQHRPERQTIHKRRSRSIDKELTWRT